MKTNCHNRGSVLMEFIIVFPIYLVLFGGVFMIGDMLVHATRLASAERAVAFDLQTEGVTGMSPGTESIQDKLFHIGGEKPEITDTRDAQDSLSREKESKWYADTEVDHPWSLRAAIKMLDKYKLPVGGTAGRLLYATEFLGDVGPLDYSEATSDGDFMDIMRGNDVNMRSKNKGSSESPRRYSYNYYTLKKTKYSNGFLTWRDNRRYSSDLVAHSEKIHAWRSQVWNEKYHEVVNDADSNTAKGAIVNSETADYRRYHQFVEWSK